MTNERSTGAAEVAAVIILAAGEGKRMRSATPKVLHELGGRSLVGHAVVAAQELSAQQIIVVVGHGREAVVEHLAAVAPDVRIAVQEEQNGTGHAVQCALAQAGDVSDGTVVVTYGDVPLLTGQTLAEIVAGHQGRGDAVTVLTARVPDPTGYGRIVRTGDGSVAAIVEHRDATAEQRAIDEINSGIYAFDGPFLVDALARLRPENDQGELYLTDLVGIARADGRGVDAVGTDDLWQVEGVNDRVQLAALRRELNRRVTERWMREGVTIVDPATTWIDVTVRIEQDVVLEPGTLLRGRDHDRRERHRSARTPPWSTAPWAPVPTWSGRRPPGRWLAPVPRSDRSRSCVRGRSSPPTPRPAPSWRSRTPRWVAAPKVPHLSYVGDATIGEGSTSGRRPSSSTTTAWPSTAPSGGPRPDRIGHHAGGPGHGR